MIRVGLRLDIVKIIPYLSNETIVYHHCCSIFEYATIRSTTHHHCDLPSLNFMAIYKKIISNIVNLTVSTASKS
jgi:hypothetical protein